MNGMHLGRLERVDLRDYWQSEASDFTPWLAKEENLAILSEAIGIDLELEAQERSVGPFRADILCKNTANGSWVLIENQLERTDHVHLGQLLTYAAGLNTVTVVWVSAKFTEEHRAALDWLNEITDDRFVFFGLEVELWRIGDSLAAPKFNLVSKPNDWSRKVSEAAQRIEMDELSETRQLQLEYWTAFRDHLEQHSSIIRPQKPQPQNWLYFSAGRSNFYLITAMNTQQRFIYAGLVVAGPHAKIHYRLLEQQKGQIEATFGAELDWRKLPGRKESRVVVEAPFDPSDRASWPEQHAWITAKLESLKAAFGPAIRSLAAPDAFSQAAEVAEIP